MPDRLGEAGRTSALFVGVAASQILQFFWRAPNLMETPPARQCGSVKAMILELVVPAKAGTQSMRGFWIPAFAGMTFN